MGRLKLILRVGGVLCFMCGLMFIPVHYGIAGSEHRFQRGYRSVFNVLVDSGVFKTGFFKTAVLLMAIGAAVYVISLLVPGEIE